MATVYDLADDFRTRLRAGDRAAERELATAHAAALADGQAELTRLLAAAEARVAKGLPVSRGWLQREARLDAVLNQVSRGLDRLGPVAGRIISARQRSALAQARSDSLRLVRATLAPLGDARADGVVANFARAPEGALEALVGFLSDGSPLTEALARLGPDARITLGRELTVGLTLGRHPSVVARRAAEALDAPRAQVARIARTEALRAYRESTRRDYAANPDLVAGWTWHSALGPHTCPACWAMHGTRHGPDERLDGHPQCRCAMVPIPRTWAELGFPDVDEDPVTVERGDALFDRQPDATKRAVLGPLAFRAYERGEVSLTDFLARRESAAWGTTRYARSLRAIRGGYGGEQVGLAAQGTYRPAPLPAVDPEAPTPIAQGPTPPRTGAEVRRALEEAVTRRRERASQANRELAAVRREAEAVTDRTLRLPHGSPEREAGNRRIDELDALEQRLRSEVRALASERGDWTLDVLAAEKPWRLKHQLVDWPRSARRRTQRAEIESGLEWFRRVAGIQGEFPKARFVAVDAKTDLLKGRSYYSDASAAIHLDEGAEARTVVHELGHWLEDRVSRIDQAALAWRDGRTQGEALVKMSDVTGQTHFTDDEVTRPDKFVHPYVGKDYGPKHTEVLSMGLEKMFEDALKFARDDPDHFDFVIDVLRGHR